MDSRHANPFTSHPAAVGESYRVHLRNASHFGVQMLLAGLACLIHAVLPFLFVHTGSNCISRLHQRMSARLKSDSAVRS